MVSFLFAQLLNVIFAEYSLAELIARLDVVNALQFRHTDQSRFVKILLLDNALNAGTNTQQIGLHLLELFRCRKHGRRKTTLRVKMMLMKPEEANKKNKKQTNKQLHNMNKFIKKKNN